MVQDGQLALKYIKYSTFEIEDILQHKYHKLNIVITFLDRLIVK